MRGFTSCWNPDIYLDESAGTCHHFPSVAPGSCFLDSSCPVGQYCRGTHCVPVPTSGIDCTVLGPNCQTYQPPHRAVGCLCDACPAQACDTQTGGVTCAAFTACTLRNGQACVDPDLNYRRQLETNVQLSCEPFSPACQQGTCHAPYTRTCSIDDECDVFENCSSSSKCDIFSTDPYPPLASLCPDGCKAIPQPHQQQILCDCAVCPAPDAGAPDAGAPDAGSPDAGSIFPVGPPCDPNMPMPCLSGVCQRQYTLCNAVPQALDTYACVSPTGGLCNRPDDCGDNYNCVTGAPSCVAVDCNATRTNCPAFSGLQLAIGHSCVCPGPLCVTTTGGPVDPVIP